MLTFSVKDKNTKEIDLFSSSHAAAYCFFFCKTNVPNVVIQYEEEVQYSMVANSRTLRVYYWIQNLISTLTSYVTEKKLLNKCPYL